MRDWPVRDQQKQLVAAKPSSHLIGARFANGGRTLAAAYFDDEARELLDPAAVRDQALLDAALPKARNEIVNESDRGGMVTIAASRGGSGLHRYLAFERATGKLTPLYAEREIPETDLVAPQQVGPSAALSMRAALTLPRAQAASGAAVVVVNRAESPDEVLGFDPEVQALASRDIAVLEIDLGHNAITGQQTLPWVERLSAAVGEAAAWLVQQGIADPKRVGVYGSGLGGYAAMAAAAREPARFRAVAALSPVTSLREFGRESATYGMRTWPAWVRDRRETRHAAAHREHFAEALRAPLFLAHGEEASFAHVSQSRALAKALRRAGRAVAYTELAVETDVPQRLASRARYYAEWLAFFERELAPPAPKES